jgi:branched-chain amino acid transport system substrate-binding protein
MTRTLAAALLALALASGASGATGADPGVSSNEIVLGGTAALTGPEAAYYEPVARGAQAYFAYVNARGGVFGRKITYKVVDDGYDPTKTVEATRQLIQQDRVFAIFNSIGTEHTLAVRPLVNQAKVPHLFLGTGSRSVAKDTSKYPWTMGFLPSFFGEGRTYGAYLASHLKKPRVAVLYEDDDYGRDMLAGIRAGLGKKGRVAASASYSLTDADVSSQVAKLKASGANVFAIFALPKQAIQAFLAANRLGWNAKAVVSGVSVDPFVMGVVRASGAKRIAEGAVSSAYLKVATDPALAKDPGVKLYKKVMAGYCKGCDVNALAHLYGMAVSYTMVETLKRAGRNLTRAGLLRAATHLRLGANPFLQPGLVLQTGPRDYYPIERLRLMSYVNGRWKPLGKTLVTARP